MFVFLNPSGLPRTLVPAIPECDCKGMDNGEGRGAMAIKSLKRCYKRWR